MAITIIMLDQINSKELNGRTTFAHINPKTGKLDAWGLVVDERPVFEEGGMA
jgi:hypothetical protein